MLHDCNVPQGFLPKNLAFGPRVWCNSVNFPKRRLARGSGGLGNQFHEPEPFV